MVSNVVEIWEKRKARTSIRETADSGTFGTFWERRLLHFIYYCGIRHHCWLSLEALGVVTSFCRLARDGDNERMKEKP